MSKEDSSVGERGRGGRRSESFVFLRVLGLLVRGLQLYEWVAGI
jgi:hypothetical protein